MALVVSPARVASSSWVSAAASRSRRSRGPKSSGSLRDRLTSRDVSSAGRPGVGPVWGSLWVVARRARHHAEAHDDRAPARRPGDRRHPRRGYRGGPRRAGRVASGQPARGRAVRRPRGAAAPDRRARAGARGRHAVRRAARRAGRRCRRDGPSAHEGTAGWRLGPIAVAPDVRGHGIGTRLLRVCRARIDATGCAAVLETDSSRTVDFFGRFGFAVVARRVRHGVPTWAMARPPTRDQETTP